MNFSVKPPTRTLNLAPNLAMGGKKLRGKATENREIESKELVAGKKLRGKAMENREPVAGKSTPNKPVAGKSTPNKPVAGNKPTAQKPTSNMPKKSTAQKPLRKNTQEKNTPTKRENKTRRYSYLANGHPNNPTAQKPKKLATGLEQARSVHFIGIGGIGMSGIAEFIHKSGYKVSGSDPSHSPQVAHLESVGIKVYPTHRPANLKGVDLVVYSSAIPATNPELRHSLKSGIITIGRARMLSELMRMQCSVAVGGTHGKTTVTAMIAHILAEARKDPTVIMGGITNKWGSNLKIGKGEWLITEADESDGSFTKLPSTAVVITNIEPEHMSHYKTEQALEEAFFEFASHIPYYGFIVMGEPSDAIGRLSKRLAGRRVITTGFGKTAMVRASNFRTPHNAPHSPAHSTTKTSPKTPNVGDTPNVGSNNTNADTTNVGDTPNVGSKFDLHINNQPKRQVQMATFGRHNVLNALTAVAVAHKLGVSTAKIVSALASFSGVKRRFSKIAELNSATLIDDYAHHPTEIKATLAAASKAAKNKVIAVVEPHRYSRLAEHFEEFATAFGDAAKVLITPIYAAGETKRRGVSVAKLVAAIQKHSGNAIAVKNKAGDLIDSLTHSLRGDLKQGNYIVFMGAGSISKIAHQTAETLALPAALHRLTTKNAPLGARTWLKCGGNAEVLFTPTKLAELVKSIKAIAKTHTRLTVFGGGANTLVRDGGVEGITLKLTGSRFSHIETKGNTITAGAASQLRRVSLAATKAGLSGFEFMEGIPGTVGGGLAMNAGAFGSEVAHRLVALTAVDRNGNVITHKPKRSDFGYRTNHLPKGWIFVSASWQGVPAAKTEIRQTVAQMSRHRAKSQPLRATAGSVFTNPTANSNPKAHPSATHLTPHSTEGATKSATTKSLAGNKPAGNTGKLSAGNAGKLPIGKTRKKAWQLIQQAGCGEMRVGGAQISPLHANFIVTSKNATASHCEELITKTAQAVKQKCGVQLGLEIRIIGRAK